MKTYRQPRELLHEVEHALATAPSFHYSPLDDVVTLLCEGRHYNWVGLYLQVDAQGSQQLLRSGSDSHPGQLKSPLTRKKILISVKLAGRELGFLGVESDDENAFGAEDRVFLEQVSTLLARFLTSRGKYLIRKARSSQSTAESRRSAAAGEK